ncbi:GerMN domain-containing protein [Acidaminobacter hydrogenoformans]|uniref:Sporulation and spore germination n=1 Tax=Acidaminobacter hydrogenoformans DSM 2784 TaxID=1120920 RepID=A0A1G5S2B5_9FIRM|nr:GerMN domain-containing protein [Acidaminobacter hydrogenoformans]SCZ79891.1 Sporulation and spore germination [Acidaminobacter hydrogenoformans DSM 2784]
MSKFLFNFVLLTVMFFILTTMPVNKQILNFNFSFEGFTEWEQGKIPEEEEPGIVADGLGDATLTTSTAYLFQPESLVVLVEGTGEVVEMASDIRNQMTLTIYDKDRQVEVLTGDQIPFKEDRLIDKSKVELALDIPALALEAGHYKLELGSESTHLAAEASTVSAEISTFAGKRYIPARQVANTRNVSIQTYYPDQNLMHLVPLSQETVNDKVLRTTMNTLTSPPPAGLGLLNEASTFRVPNIQYAQGTLDMYTRSADLAPFSTGSTRSMLAVEAIRHTFFNVDYVQRIKFHMDGKSTGAFLHGMDLGTVYERDNTPMAWLGVRTSGERLLLGPVKVNPAQSNPAEDVLALLKSGIAQEGSSDALIAPLPSNVIVVSTAQDGATLKVDLGIEGELYGGDQALAAFMFDALTQSLTSISGIDAVSYTMGGAPITSLNGLSLTEVQRKKALINPLE